MSTELGNTAPSRGKSFPFLFKYQQDVVEALEAGKLHVNIPTGGGRMYIICVYAMHHPDKQFIVSCSPMLAAAYLDIINKHNIKTFN